MDKLLLLFFLVLTILYIVPILVYGAGAVVAGLKMPAGVSPKHFLIGVFISKIGTSLAFVLIFYMAHSALTGQWQLYALAWWLMFVFGEIGQTFGSGYSWKEALAGIISETVYLPLSAWLVDSLIVVR
jgi:hypothetical protein